MKECYSCNKHLDLDQFPKRKNTKDGFDTYCIVCRKNYRKVRYIENKDKEIKNAKDWYKVNKNKVLEYKKRPETIKKIKNHQKSYRELHKSKRSEYRKNYNKVNKDREKQNNQIWRKNNPCVQLSLNAKRRAAKIKATPRWLSCEDLDKIKQIYILSKTLEQRDGIKRHVDHIIPLQGKNICGLHVPWNLQILEASENISKSNKLEESLLFSVKNGNN